MPGMRRQTVHRGTSAPSGWNLAQLCDWLTTHRSRRVAWLLGAIVLLNGADWALTLNCLCTTGMFESNPIVHTLAKSQAPALAITAFKFAMVLTGVAILFKLRHRREAELAAWMQLIVLILLTVRWMQYLHVIDGVEILLANDPSWIVLR